jgi:hypothetical protein
LLHDYLVFAAVLVSKIGYLVPTLGYERVTVGVYPFVYPTVYPVVQVDIHPSICVFVVLERATGDAFTDGSLGNAEPSGRFLNGETVYPASIPFVHTGDTRPLGAGPKALRSHPRGSREQREALGRAFAEHLTDTAGSGLEDLRGLVYRVEDLVVHALD